MNSHRTIIHEQELVTFNKKANIFMICHGIAFPINMPLSASIGPALDRCCQHRPSTGPALADNGMSTGLLAGMFQSNSLLFYISINMFSVDFRQSMGNPKALSAAVGLTI